MPSVAKKLDEAEAILRANDISEARREASLLLALALKRDKAFLIAHPEYILNSAEEQILDEIVQRRSAHEPFQYISGVQEFYGLDFKVTPDVLIPRPETEMVVERAIAILGSGTNISFCDIGVGSGCIAISVLYHVRDATAVGLDVSHRALAIARANAVEHGVNDRLALIESNVFSALSGERFDLIVSNPPYVPVADLGGLQAEVRDFEPHAALFGGDDGLSIIRQIVVFAPQFLKPSGHLLLEIGFDQSTRVIDVFDRSIWQSPKLFPDLQGIPRLVDAQLI